MNASPHPPAPVPAPVLAVARAALAGERQARIVLGAYLLSGTPGYRQAGVHIYAQELLRALAQTGDALTALVSPTAKDNLSLSSDSAIDIRPASRTTERPLSRILIEQIETPCVLRTLGAVLYHGLGFVAPLRAPCATVVSVMDLSFITQPQAHKLFNRTYLRLLSRSSCRQAARVITISEWTKRDVVQHFGIPPERVAAIPLGVDHGRFKPQAPGVIAAFRAKHGISDQAIFSLGSLEPRKNLPRLIEAFAELCSQAPDLARPGQSPAAPAQLFIGGNLAWKYGAVFARIKQLGLEGRVRLIGRVSDDDLPKWYGACAVTAYPSLYEGFGLPPLEAMACGAPVVTSNTSALPEVVGEAGLMVDPADVGALSAALRRVLTDAAMRAQMQTRSLDQARGFTWQNTAQRTLATYRHALGET